jgi:hypothetical protein
MRITLGDAGLLLANFSLRGQILNSLLVGFTLEKH